MTAESIAIDGVADAQAFLNRLRRLDDRSLVRLRPAGDLVELWAVLPFGVLVTRTVPGSVPGDITVRGDDLLAAVTGAGATDRRYDEQWRGSLPASAGTVVETVPADEIRRIGVAAADTLRARRGQGVGDRRLRDALLDHEALRVSADDGHEHVVTVRLVVALLRMGFIGPDPVEVRLAGTRLGLAATFGTAWRRDAGVRLL